MDLRPSTLVIPPFCLAMIKTSKSPWPLTRAAGATRSFQRRSWWRWWRWWCQDQSICQPGPCSDMIYLIYTCDKIATFFGTILDNTPIVFCNHLITELDTSLGQIHLDLDALRLNMNWIYWWPSCATGPCSRCCDWLYWGWGWGPASGLLCLMTWICHWDPEASR